MGGVLILLGGGMALVQALVSHEDGFEMFVPAMLMLFGASALVDARRGRSASRSM